MCVARYTWAGALPLGGEVCILPATLLQSAHDGINSALPHQRAAVQLRLGLVWYIASYNGCYAQLAAAWAAAAAASPGLTQTAGASSHRMARLWAPQGLGFPACGSGVLLLRLLLGHHQPGHAEVAQLIA
jgi:hypothetical protein